MPAQLLLFALSRFIEMRLKERVLTDIRNSRLIINTDSLRVSNGDEGFRRKVIF